MSGAKLMTRSGSSLPLWFDDYLEKGTDQGMPSIATSDYDPIATYQASAKATTDKATLYKAIQNGFIS